MKSDLQGIKEELNRKATERAAALEKSRADLKEATARFNALKATMQSMEHDAQNTQGLAEYNELRAELKEAEGALKFCQKKAQAVNEAFISDAEYKSIARAIDSEVEKIQEKHAPKIQKALADLIALLDSYCAEVADYDAIKNQAFALNKTAGGFVSGIAPSKRNELINYKIDALEYQPHILGEYFKHKELIDGVKIDPEKVVKNEHMNPERLRIALALTGRR